LLVGYQTDTDQPLQTIRKAVWTFDGKRLHAVL
jgi:hypothetical protein